MLGILLASAGSLLGEISSSIGKKQVKLGKESLYVMGFLSSFWSAIWFLAIVLYRNSFVFSAGSLPTFIPRVILEIILAQLSIYAIVKADRSTFSFLRILTIPILLTADVLFGYSFSAGQILAIGIMIFCLFLISYSRGISKKGFWASLGSAVLAAATISLYKYNISHFNSVEAEQLIVISILTSYFFFASCFIQKRSPHYYLFRRPFVFQSAANGLAGIAGSFAYLFAPAAIITAVLRSSSIFWAILSGRLYFREKNFILKLAVSVLLASSIILFLKPDLI